MEDRNKKRQRCRLLYSIRKQLEKSRMSRSAPCTRGLDCSGTTWTLVFEIDISGDIFIGNFIDSNKNTLPCVLEDCNNSQPLIMGPNFNLEETSTPMASMSNLDHFRIVRNPSTSSTNYLSA